MSNLTLNVQTADGATNGSVELPEALHPWLRGKTRLTAEGELA